MHPSVKDIIVWIWIVLGVIWCVGALTAKRSARSQSAGSRLLHIVLAGAAFIIGFSRRFEFGLWATPFVGDSAVVAYTGLLLTALGAGLAAWARFSLGRNWSGTITVKEDHKLKTGGPYAIVRHPIYSGLLLGLLGTAIFFRELRGLISLGIVFLLFILKARIEERFMTEEFGSQYQQYRERVKALIPFVY